MYTDHLFDAYGADRATTPPPPLLDPLAAVVKQTYRLDPLGQIDPFDEVGVPVDYPLATGEHYGDADHVPPADIAEVRVAATAPAVDVLVRTTTMTSVAETAVLLLADTAAAASRASLRFRHHVRRRRDRGAARRFRPRR